MCAQYWAHMKQVQLWTGVVEEQSPERSRVKESGTIV